MNLQKITLEVVALAKEVGSFIYDEGQKFSEDKVEVKSKNSLVSYVDKTAEAKIVEQLKKILPEAGFIAEEGTESEQKEYNWIIDPLDGTTNFIHGIPAHAVSIALAKGEELLSGVVYEIGRAESFYAWKEGGAYLNEKPIHVSQAEKLEDTLIATGFPYYDYDRLKEFQNCLAHYMHNTRGVRRIGSAAIDLVYTAAGRFDCFFEYGLHPWDVAAGALIVKEAGGVVTDYSGGTNYINGREILASSKTLSNEFLAITKKFFQDKH